MDVCPFDDAPYHMGSSCPSAYLLDYLDYLHAKTIVVEDKYIDKDYLIDYSNFYSRSFKEHSKYTTRLHFFGNSFSKSEFMGKFHSDTTFQSDLSENYLGFIVVKPLEIDEKYYHIGRTLLATYPASAEEGDSRKYL